MDQPWPVPKVLRLLRSSSFFEEPETRIILMRSKRRPEAHFWWGPESSQLSEEEVQSRKTSGPAFQAWVTRWWKWKPLEPLARMTRHWRPEIGRASGRERG